MKLSARKLAAAVPFSLVLIARRRLIILSLAILTWIAGSASAQQSAPAAEMSAWQTRRVLATASRDAALYVARFKVHYFPIDIRSFQVTAESAEFDAVGSKGEKLHARIMLKDSERLTPNCNRTVCWLVTDSKRTYFVPATSDRKGYVLVFGGDPSPAVQLCQGSQNPSECMHAPTSFVEALKGLRARAISGPSANGDFHTKAATWRALATKPPLAQGVRVRRLAAEDAVKRQKPQEALNYYELGVESDPMWPQGWFNAALLAGELGFYADAAEHMQNYLELLPDAPDAQSIRDQIDLWRFKAGQQSPSSPKEPK